MPRSPLTPSLRRHKHRSLGVVTLNGHDHYLGHWPAGKRVPPPSVQSAYDALIAEWLAGGRRLPTPEPAPGLTVAELLLRFWQEHVTTHYRHPDGTPTGEADNYKHALRPLRELYALLPAAEFTPKKLKAVRESLILRGLARSTVNQCVSRIGRAFRWAVEEELVPVEVYQALKAVAGLKAGRSAARETEPVKPVDDARVEATLPHLPRPVRGMVMVQRLTGCRPGEAARMRLCEIDRTGAVWLYRPARHKTAWRGKARVIPIGPKAQAVILEHAKPDPAAYLFPPADAKADLYAGRRANRKTKPRPGTRAKKATPRRTARPFYPRHSYDEAVYRACDRAFPPPAELARRRVPGRRGTRRETPKEWSARLGAEKWAELLAWQKAHRWHPNQLRHSRLTEVRRDYGLEGAQVVGGHEKASTTELYAERNLALAVAIVGKTG